MPALDAIEATVIPNDLVPIIEEAPLPDLDDQPQDAVTLRRIESLVAGSRYQGTLVESAMWLLAGQLERSHRISQQHGSAEGSFWHGIMHRREGDFGNAKYWFRRVGDHPVLDQLQQRIRHARDEREHVEPSVVSLIEGTWFAGDFVDLCQTAVRNGSASLRDSLREIQWWEWQLLLAHTLTR